MVAWGLAEIANRSRVWRLVMAGLGAGLLLACGLDTRYQLGFWRDSVTLFKQVLAVTPENNPMGHFYLGVAYKGLHDLDHAATSFAAAVQADPSFSKARTELGNVLVYQEKYAAAEQEFRRVLERHPDNVAVHVTLGFALAKQHRDAEAQTEYLIARQLNPADDTIRALLAASTRRVEAELTLTNLTRQLGTNASPELHIQIGATESGLGHFRAAMDHYQTALRLAADSPDGLNNLAWLLATCPDATVRNGVEAVHCAERASLLPAPKGMCVAGTLAAAYAEAGRFKEAVATAEKAVATETAAGETRFAELNTQLLTLYRAGQPFHEPPPRKSNPYSIDGN